MPKIRPRTKAVMKIAMQLMSLRVEADIADCHLDRYGWLNYTTYEPIKDTLEAILNHVLPALREIMSDDEREWEWRIFGADGFLDFAADGRRLVKGSLLIFEAVDGSCAISEFIGGFETEV